MRETDIRGALRSYLAARNRDPSTAIIEELGLCLGSARVDIAVVNGKLQGYEIKSEQDTLKRLPGQAEVYNRVFDSVTIASTVRHLARIADIVPAWWGLIEPVARGSEIRFRRIRPASPNPSVDPCATVQLLWRDEALEELERLGFGRGLYSKPKRVLWQKLVEHLSPTQLRDCVRSRLKARQGWRSG